MIPFVYTCMYGARDRLKDFQAFWQNWIQLVSNIYGMCILGEQPKSVIRYNPVKMLSSQNLAQIIMISYCEAHKRPHRAQIETSLLGVSGIAKNQWRQINTAKSRETALQESETISITSEYDFIALFQIMANERNTARSVT